MKGAAGWVKDLVSVCNMSIEAARMIAADIFNYLRNRPLPPKGDEREPPVTDWRSLKTFIESQHKRAASLAADVAYPVVMPYRKLAAANGLTGEGGVNRMESQARGGALGSEASV